VKHYGGLAIGLELSKAVDVARNNFPEDIDVLIVQADALNPPFVKDSIDFGCSIGVLHHTPLPALGLKQLIGVVKHGGGVAISVYPAVDGLYHDPSTYKMRHKVNKRKIKYGEDRAYKFALCYAKFAAFVLYPLERLLAKIPRIGSNSVLYLRTYCYVLAAIPDRRWRVLDTFDAITPTFASTHTPEEIQFWFDTFGCRKAKQTAWGSTSWVAVK
jgi:SAM-dependent methyltransferase